jgi:hypothetical protein|tara:strand:+ start:385 stop:543 length:159 start_codon:yes stop_codon:yes gene_type:complete
MKKEIALLVLLAVIVCVYLYFNRATLIPVNVVSYSNVPEENILEIPFIKLHS